MPDDSKPPHIKRLADFQPDEEGDFFAMLTSKEELTTRDDKPYLRIGLRDSEREVRFPVWNESPWFAPFRDEWSPGDFFKIRAFYRESKFGPQLDIRKIRLATSADRLDGFDPNMCKPRSRFNPETMFADLMAIVDRQITDQAIRNLVRDILTQHREFLLTLAAAKHHHHAYLGGWLEHVLSVTRTCSYLATKYAEEYSHLEPPLDRDLVLAGAVLHDIGKLREYVECPTGVEYTSSGNLIGHILQGRDILREAAASRVIDPEKMLRLEHVLVAHQRLPEWGSPKPPMTPEALIVHYADDLDAKLNMMATALADTSGDGPMTSRHNPLRQPIFRGNEFS
ncbi:MAG: HD domain-containing protein [Pirellulales bacterium]|nr:HD domain-containing protein [Pirellulales bacterium]